MDIKNFIAEFKKTFVYDLLSVTLKDEQLFEHFVDGDKVIWLKEQTRQMWEMWQQAKKVAVPDDSKIDGELLQRYIDSIRHFNYVGSNCEFIEYDLVSLEDIITQRGNST